MGRFMQTMNLSHYYLRYYIFLSERAKEDAMAGRFGGSNDEQWEISS